MKRSKWTNRLAALGLGGVLLAGAALAAGDQGSQSNPLVTLSYLNDVAVPAIMKQVDERIAQREAELEKKTASAAVFQTVEVGQGRTLVLKAGSQLLFRSGNLQVPSSGLLDLTDGTTVWSLTANHLYLTTGEMRLAVKEAGTVMVQGGYAVE